MTGHDTDEGGDGDVREPTVIPGRPDTGDDEVDQTLRALDEGLADDGADPLETLSEAHRRLQSRLTSPEPDPPGPGAARPGPR